MIMDRAVARPITDFTHETIPAPPCSLFTALVITACVGTQACAGDLQDWRAQVGDRNRDGVVNILDVAARLAEQEGTDCPDRGVGSERLVAEVVQGGLPNVPAGGSITFRIRLENSTTPLFGYSLGLSLQPADGTGGTVLVDIGQTNFFEPQNLIVAGGHELDPVFSVILDDGKGGVFINANTADNSTVLAVPSVNDILAEVVVTAADDALGDFTLDLSEVTALSDGIGLPVLYEYQPLVIEVTAAPCSGADLAKPFQILDLSDLVEFVILFSNEDPMVDYAVPVGLFDLADVLAFVGFFLSGC